LPPMLGYGARVIWLNLGVICFVRLTQPTALVNKGKLDRSELTDEQRKIAAQFFRDVAERTGGPYFDAAS